MLERLQWTVTRITGGLESLLYEKRLKDLGLFNGEKTGRGCEGCVSSGGGQCLFGGAQ